MNEDIAGSQELDEPFPLKRRFQRRFLPALIGFVGVFLAIVGFTASEIVQSIYLQLAQRRAETIAHSVADAVPDAWQALMSGQSLSDLEGHAEVDQLTKAFETESYELKLSELKVYDLNRRTLYATDQSEIGATEAAQVLRDVMSSGTGDVVTKTMPDGTEQYELYVPLFDEAGDMRAVFELYEPVEYLNAILTRAAVPIITVPGLLLILLALALNRLVGRAQLDIDARTSAINELRRRLESFVSSTAVDAARSAGAGAGIESRKVTTTIFFSDIRDFTGFSEQNSPEDVVRFLNEIMGLQVDILRAHGGDVDKMIGDAVLARFDAADGSRQAVAAAREIQQAAKAGNFPRALGIGVYRGDVISGAIGPEDRRDFTMIGDTVNVAARLCSAAGAGEVVVDADLADDDFNPVEEISVKGRQGVLRIRRLIVT